MKGLSGDVYTANKPHLPLQTHHQYLHILEPDLGFPPFALVDSDSGTLMNSGRTMKMWTGHLGSHWAQRLRQERHIMGRQTWACCSRVTELI